MATKIRHWLTGWALPNLRPSSFFPSTTAKPIDDLEQAFLIATANDINKVLPHVLERLQHRLDTQLSHAHSIKLGVFFHYSDSGESFVNHAPDFVISAAVIHALHRRFGGNASTKNQADATDSFPLITKEESWNVLPHPLVKEDHFRAWLLFMSEGKNPIPQKLHWYRPSIEQSLSKGIEGWYQREAKIRAALEAERAIFAAELHDSLAQILGYLRIKSATLKKHCQVPEYEAIRSISDDLADYTHCAYRQTRELITSSRLTIKANSLAQGVTASIQEFEEQSMIVFEFDNRHQQNTLSPQHTTQILYVIRESLNNIVRHSHATHARVVISNTDPFLNVVIEDNGDGIDLKAARKDSFGLHIMRERAERIGAQIQIGKRPNGGTRVELKLEVTPK